MKKRQKYTKKHRPKAVSWSWSDILAVQLGLCLLLGLGGWLNIGPLQDWLGEILQQEPLALPDEQEQQELLEAVETFLNQYIYEENGGGSSAGANSGSAVPENCSLQTAATEYRLTAPVSGRITSHFGWRAHPITEKQDFHSGIDIAAAEGTAIHATADGIVTEVGWSDSYGNYLVLEHSGDFSTKYAHCQRLIAEEGAVIRKGERIALVGSTGISTGPHVHFECVVEGQRVDPLWLLP